MIVRLFAVVLSLTLATDARAQNVESYPNHTVKLVVPFPPGGPSDLFARLVADNLQSAFGQPFIVENRPGAAGTIGTTAVMNSQPDGYTLLFSSNSNQVIAPLLRNPRPYDPVKNFRPISMLLSYPFYLVASINAPAQTVPDLVAFAKAKPGALNFASIGIGSAGHLMLEMFKSRAGIDVMHIPYKGVGPTQTAIMGGEVHYVFDSVGASKPLVDAGKMRGLAVTGRTRSWAAPDTPTLEELGFTGLDPVIWLGVFAPQGTPDAIVAKLEEKLKAFTRLPEIEQRIKDYAATRIGGTAEEFAATLTAEQTMWSQIIEASKIQINN